MRMRALITGTLATSFLLLAATPMLGQERHHGGMMGQDSARTSPGMMGQEMMGQGMMGQEMMMTRPGALLGLTETLGLSADQTARLEEVRAGAREAHQAHMEQARAARQEANGVLEDEAPDMDAYTRALQSAMSHMALAHASMIRASVEARSVLTDEQRARLESAAQIMRAMHRMQGMQGMHQEMHMQQHGGMRPGGL